MRTVGSGEEVVNHEEVPVVEGLFWRRVNWSGKIEGITLSEGYLKLRF